MDADELLVLLGSSAVALSAGVRWCQLLLTVGPLQTKGSWGIRLLLGVWPIALLLALGLGLIFGAARDVREDLQYIALFMVLGAAWLVGVARGLALIGISVRDDAFERRNLAALIAVLGALTGGLLAYGFSNLGEGDTIWTTIGPAVLASSSCFLLWGVHQAASATADAIAIGRDIPCALRFAGMAVGTGLICGRAVAGDYESAAATVRDFAHQGWPAVLLALLAICVQRRLERVGKPQRRARVTFGIVPALLYVAIGLVDCVAWGSWHATGAS